MIPFTITLWLQYFLDNYATEERGIANGGTDSSGRLSLVWTRTPRRVPTFKWVLMSAIGT